ncbi:acylphosphatase-2 isoform X2 [Apteryx rowi]|uniref:acylphosphatase-2 isoform X2 n=1 Tax=Apteryx rowi TaxID=308060 RepID=UPI000E1CFF8B|nr:acylphosphatase-2 isoform X2 [Apteryx rowi]
MGLDLLQAFALSAAHFQIRCHRTPPGCRGAGFEVLLVLGGPGKGRGLSPSAPRLPRRGPEGACGGGGVLSPPPTAGRVRGRFGPRRRRAAAFAESLSLARCRPHPARPRPGEQRGSGPPAPAAAMSGLARAPGALKSVDYEVFGRVQGVCFRMLAASAASSELEHLNAQYTEEEARKLGVVGWVKNTSKGTVTGQVQGPEEKVNAIYRPSAKYPLGQEILAFSLPGAASE